MENETLVKIKAISQRLGINPQTVKRWATEEGLPAYKVGRDLYFYPSQVEAWLEGRKIESSNSDSR